MIYPYHLKLLSIYLKQYYISEISFYSIFASVNWELN